MKKNLAFSVLFLASVLLPAFAADMPNELLGKWAGDDEMLCQDKKSCDCSQVNEAGLIIKNKSISHGSSSSCEVKKISGKIGNYKISQKCSDTEGIRNTTKSYDVTKDSLKVKESLGEHIYEFKFKRCHN
jgi:hypothetical protein